MAGTAWAVDRLVGLRRHRPGQAERHRPRAAPDERGLAPRGVVLERHARIVVGALEHRCPVVLHRLGPHHPHPRHGQSPPSVRVPASGNRRVAIVFFLVCGYSRNVGDVKGLFGGG